MYTRVKSLAELEAKKLNGRFIAGGTDLVPLMKLGLKEPRLLIDVTKLPELHLSLIHIYVVLPVNILVILASFITCADATLTNIGSMCILFLIHS